MSTLYFWLWDLVFICFIIWLQRTCTWCPFYLPSLKLISILFILSVTWVSIHSPQIHIISIYSQTIILCVIPVRFIIIHIKVWVLQWTSTLVKCMTSIEININLGTCIINQNFLWVAYVLIMILNLLINIKKRPIVYLCV